ncbi:LOW QUALITY PROTEIN: DNA repair-scaffolding protein-like [Argopecten irradians]|uniref:LOW QUALITY PROTEIN: DNA repair-scaffolding protein-like n=1 Tax=Argopecten irradians TaxID=31199 RepID=UPI00371B33BA
MSQYLGKRKLIYSPETDDGCSYSPKTSMQDKRKSIGEWQSFGEGFSGFGGVESNNPAKRKRTPLNKEKIANTFRIDPFKAVDDSIAWSSSDDEDSKQPIKEENHLLSVRKSGHSKYKAGELKNLGITDVVISNDESSSEPSWSLSGAHNKYIRSDTENIAGNQSQVSEITATICSYESEESRQSHSQKKTDGRAQVSSEVSQDIESMKSESPAPSQASSSSKVKASDWVKTLNLKTPSKDSQSSDIDVLEDSAKKKKKFKRGGFADQLNRVQKRDRSSLRIWSHQQNSGETGVQKATSTSKIVTVEVVSFELLYSVHLARCDVLAGPMETGQILVLFSTAVVQQHSLQEGSIVLIHPPWQQMDLKQTHQKVLLCTNYCKVTQKADLHSLESPKVSTQSKVKVNKQSHDFIKVKGQWNCPCTADLVKSYQSCPAHLLPCFPALAVTTDTICSDKERASDSSTLTVVTSTEAVKSSTTGTPSQTILESIHKLGSRQGGQGHSFVGLVHRVVQKQMEQRSRWCVLVEDGHGTMCEVILPKDRLPVCDVVLQGEGKVFSFTGLTLHSRTNRERDFGLFSLIDSVWSGVVPNSQSQESEQNLSEPNIYCEDSVHTISKPARILSEGGIQTSKGNDSDHQALPGTSSTWTVEPPGFCYIMKGNNSVVVELIPRESSGLLSRYRPVTLTNLSNSCKKPGGKRFCFVAKVLSILNMPSDNRDADGSQVTTSPRRRPQSYLYVWTGEAINGVSPSSVRVAYGVSDSVSGQVMFFKDVFYHKDQLCCDVFSQILPCASVPERCLTSKAELTEAERRTHQGEITIPSLSCELPELALCKVLGRIVGVDESSAYSWDVCSYCGSDKLVHQQSELHCLDCGQSVLEPVNKMTMDVHVTCDGMDMPVTISLLQDCIEKLLPEDTAEEGYEIESVLGKDIGTICCVVCSKPNKEGHLQGVKLQQVAVVL